MSVQRNARAVAVPGLRAVVALPVMAVVVIGGVLLRAVGGAEMPLSIALNTLHVGVVGTAGDLLYRGVGPVPAIAGTVLATLILLLMTRRWATASTFAFTVAASWLSVAAVKLLVHRSRPDATALPHPYHPVQIDASYPSGHMGFVTAVVAASLLLLPPGRVRRLVAVIRVIAVGGTALLLTVDAVHYPTDVLASIVWVAAVAPLACAAWTSIVLPRVVARPPRDVQIPAERDLQRQVRR